MDPIVAVEIERYADRHTSPGPPHLLALAEDTKGSTASPQMMVGHVEGRFLAMLVHLLRARRVLEIGTFTGYSSLCMAEGLAAGGTIVTCEVNEEHVAIARRHIAASPYASSIDVRHGPALETIAGLEGPFDLVFIDADKTRYGDYYEAVLPLLADHGVIAVDNVLWSGRVLDPGAHDPETRALQTFNDLLRRDPRVECVLLTVRDGITLVRRRQGT